MRVYAPGDPLVFCHIPKSAGSSLQAALIKALQPERVAGGVDLALLGGYDLDGLSAKTRSSFIFSPEELPADATLVTGHLSPGTTMSRFPDADHMTTLRSPRLRVVSQWIHSRALSEFDLRHWGGSAGVAFRAGRQPFLEYLQTEMIAPNVDNTITRFLTWPHPLLQRTTFIAESHDDELLAAAIDRLDRFAHVGVVENPSFLADLGAWLGRELPNSRLNERTSIPRSRRPDLTAEMSPSTIELLDHRTRLDRQIWTHVASKALDVDPDRVLQASWDKSMDRYANLLENPGERRPVRQAVEAVYEFKARLGSRSH